MCDHIYVNNRIDSKLDPTAHEAIANVLESQNTPLDVFEADKRAREMFKTFEHMLRLAGFEQIDALGIRDGRTGREYWR